MFQKHRQSAPRLLTPDDPDVPAEFAVFDSDELYDGMDTVRDKFSAPQTRLVVWHNPPVFAPITETAEETLLFRKNVQDMGAQVAQNLQIKNKLKEGWRSFFDPGHDYLEMGVRKHFYDILHATDLSYEQSQGWHDDTLGLVEALEECFTTNTIKLKTQFQAAAQYNFKGPHMPSYLRSNSLRAVRMITGDALRFYSEADVLRRAYHKGLRTVSLNDKAQAWTVKPWDIAFISQNTVCEKPLITHGDAPRRIMEIFDIRSREEFVASAQRPLPRAIIRPWLRRLMNGPEEY